MVQISVIDGRMSAFYFKCMFFFAMNPKGIKNQCWLGYLFHLKRRPASHSLMGLQCWVDVTLIRQIAIPIETFVHVCVVLCSFCQEYAGENIKYSP
jgi:hypothetical protein